MKNILLYICLISMFLSFSNKFFSQEKSTVKKSHILIRPNISTGFLKSDAVFSYGVRAILGTDENKGYGFEFSRFQSFDNKKKFYTIGIVLEQRLFNWFNASVGTIGYFDFDQEGRNYAGLTTNLGWEPKTKGVFAPFITYRADFVFTKEIQLINSLNIGIDIKL